MHTRCSRSTKAALLAIPVLCCQQSGRAPPSAETPKPAGSAAPADDSSRAAPPDPGPTSTPACPRFSQGRKLGRVQPPKLIEASGLAVSRKNPGVLWAHNDAAGRARLFAMSDTGRDLGRYRLAGAKVADLEDIALGPGDKPGKWYLYLGDIGANNAPRNHLIVYRVKEPKVKLTQRAKTRKVKRKRITKYRLKYPKGAWYDAETLMVDPQSSDLYIVTKTSGNSAEVFRAEATLDAEGPNPLEHAATLPVAVSGGISSALVTGGDIAADGGSILLRTYADAYFWVRHRGEGVGEALERAPCRVPLRAEPQGEAISFAANGHGYFTVSEGTGSDLYFFELQR